MNREDPIRIGTLHKPWGKKGEVIADMLAHSASDLLPKGWLMVDVDGQLVPFKYSSIRENAKQGVLVLFRDYTSPEEAKFFHGKGLFAPAETIVVERKSAIAEEDLIGIKVVDTSHGMLGSVIRTEGTTAQTVLVILKGVKEIMIPLAEDLIEGFDPEKGELTVSTPPGLVDMYLS